MSRDLRIRVRTIGAESVRSTLRGIARESARGAQATRQVTRASATEAERAARQQLASHVALERNKLRETERSARAATRVAERESRNQQRAAERAAARSRQARRALPGQIGTAVVAGGDALIGRARGYQSTLGIQSREQLTAGYIDRQERLIRLSANSGVGTDQLQGTVSSAAQGALTSQDDIVTALETAQARLVGGDTDLAYFAEHMQDFARASRAAGGSTEDWTVAVGQMQRQLGVSAEDSTELVGMLVAAARAGAIEAGDFAEQFSGILSQYKALRGDAGQGIGGAREFTAVAQALGQGGRSAPEVRTLMQNLMTGLTRGDTRRGIESGLRDTTVFDERGRLTVGFDELVRRMANDESFQSAAGRERIFGRDVQFAEAIGGLMDRSGNSEYATIGQLAGSNATEGQAVIDNFFTQLEGSSAGEVLGIRSRAEAQFAVNGGGLVEHEARLAALLTDFETQFPLTSEVMGTLRDVVTSTVSAFATMKLAMVGGTATVAAGGTAAAGGAAVAGGTGLLATGAMAVGGGVLLAPLLNALFPSSTGTGDIGGGALADQQRRRSQFDESALGAIRGLPGVGPGAVRGEVVRRATAEAQASGSTISAADIERLAEAVRVGAAQGTERGTRAATPTPGRSPDGQTR